MGASLARSGLNLNIESEIRGRTKFWLDKKLLQSVGTYVHISVKEVR